MKRDGDPDTAVGGWGDNTSDEAATVSGKPPALDDTAAAPTPEPPAVGPPVELPERPSLASYRTREVLGRGGMGEVVLAEDLEIGRNVAIKRLRSEVTSKALIDRFLREARIQALLDHPAIVPVHQIGQDADGRPFFTMKRLSGSTLGEAIKTHSETRNGCCARSPRSASRSSSRTRGASSTAT